MTREHPASVLRRWSGRGFFGILTRKMWIFPRYVLKETLLSFVLALAAFTAMLFVGNSVRFIAEQVPFLRFVRILPYMFVFILTFTMPMAILTAVVFTFGRLGLDNELTAIRASGLSLRVVVVPVLLLGLVFSLLSLPLNCWIAPECHYIMESVLFSDPSEPEIQRTDRYEPAITLPSCNVYIGSVEGKTFKDVFICKTVEGKPSEFVIADSATLRIDKKKHMCYFDLHNGRIYYIEKGVSDAEGPMPFKIYEFSAELPSARRNSRDIKEKDINRLWRELRENKLPVHKRAKARTEVHKRLSLSFSCLALILIGVPLGMLTRRGNFVAAFGASVGIIFALYYPLLLTGEVLGNMDKLSPSISMWIANVVAVVIGLFLFYRAGRTI